MVWHIEKKLGQGGAGEVYLAREPSGGRVAVKTLRLQSPEEIEGFKREAKLLLRLRHPSIAAMLGYEVDSSGIFGENRGPCFWMEYVEGGSIQSVAPYARPGQIFSWLREALEALRELHSQSILHNDLSPRNVLITPKGEVKLLDFGLATVHGFDRPIGAGTLPYLAPERLSGQASPASDLFSLGTIFYEALARRHPRSKARNFEEMLQLEAPPLEEAAPGLDDDFSLASRIIDRMIRLEPRERFLSSHDVLETLRNRRDEKGSARVEFHSAKFWGAENQFRKFKLARSLAGAGSQAYWVHGMTGVGKTRLLRELALELAIQGFRVEEFSAEDLAAAIQQIRRPFPGEYKAFIVRDLHRLESEQLTPLITLRRTGFSDPGLLVFFEWNDDLLPEDGRQVLEAMLKADAAGDIHLRNLSPENTKALLATALGEPIAAETFPILHEQTGGNPRMLLDLVEILRESGLTRKKYFTRDELESLRGLHSFEDIARFRCHSLSPEEKEILGWIASAEGEVALEWLADFHEASVGPQLAALTRRGLIREEGGRYSTFAGLPETIRQEEGEARWRERQSAWFARIPESGATKAIKARLAIKIGNSDYLGEHGLPCAVSLEEQGKFHEALDILSGALPLARSPEERSRLLRRQSNLLQRMNRFEEALAVAEEAFALNAKDEPFALKAAKYYLVTGLLHQHLGRFEEAVLRFRRCLEGESNPDTLPFRIRSLTLLGMEMLRSERLAEARQSLSQALELAGPTGRRRAEICRILGIISGQERKWAEAQKYFEESARLCREERYHVGEISTYLEEGNQALNNDRWKEAERAYLEAARIAEASDQEFQLAIAWNNQGILQRKLGDLDRALELLGKAEEIFRALGRRNNLAEHLVQHGVAQAAAGCFDSAKKMLEEAKGFSAETEDHRAKLRVAESFLKEIQDGELAEMPTMGELSPSDGHWNVELTLRRLQREDPAHGRIRPLLESLFQNLSVKLQVSFAERQDYKKYVLMKGSAKKNTAARDPKENPMNILERLSAISRDLIRENDMERVLLRLMDAAIELSGAENGFLLLKTDSTEGPIPGFSVVVARNFKKDMLEKLDFIVSLSAIRQAMESAEPVVTDNALTDPRFSQSESVKLHELKSILALPVLGADGLLGAFYLDHRFERGIFSGEMLGGLRAFADQAALALQKGRMIEDLRQANSRLSHQVEEQSGHISAMAKELSQSRLKLKHEYSEIVGRSPKMVQVLSMVDRITDSRIPVWIHGESGTGKESIARALHFNSSRAKSPFVSENCSALPETLLESELFGHKRGAFTHADRDKKGILQYADKGTIFLDEIGDMSLNLQAKLLRFLQEGEIRPLGSNEVIKVDVRVVSASNKDLPQMVQDGEFREDLFFRLNGITVHLPTLKERREDIPPLVEHFLKKAAARENRKPCRIHPDALRVLMDYPWPGNIRELENTIETAVLFAEHGVVNTKALQFKPQVFSKHPPIKSGGSRGEARRFEDPELERILLTLRDQGYHKGNAARALGISRRNLYVKLEKFKVPIEVAELKKFIDKRLAS